jgi:hypothetical protein
MMGSMESGERVAVVLDLENLIGLPPLFSGAELGNAIERVIGNRVRVTAVGWCARSLQARLAFDLARFGVRVFGHTSREADAADRILLDYLAVELPTSITTVVIGSGDHIFAPAATALRRRGFRVEVVARPGTLATVLRRSADRIHPVIAPSVPQSPTSPPALQRAA